jgi:hypothetical protein
VAGRSTIATETGAAAVARRLGLGETCLLRERVTAPGRPLPGFFANRHHYLSRKRHKPSTYRATLGLRPGGLAPLRATTPSRSWLRTEPRASASGLAIAPDPAVTALVPV